jgi:hypothetical protein
MQDIESVNRYFKKNVKCILDTCEYKPELVKKSLEEFTDEEWLNVLSTVNPEIIEYDLLNGPFDVDPTKRNLVYTSNIFSYNFIVHKMKITEINSIFQKYLDLPNTTFYGKNVFKDLVHYENSMR